MDPAAAEGVQVGSQGGDQRLAFAGLHFGDLSLMQNHAADQLDVEMPHVEHPPSRFTNHRESVGQQIVERLALIGALAQVGGTPAEVGIAEGADRRFPIVDLRQRRLHTLEIPLVLRAEYFPEDVLQHQSSPMGRINGNLPEIRAGLGPRCRCAVDDGPRRVSIRDTDMIDCREAIQTRQGTREAGSGLVTRPLPGGKPKRPAQGIRRRTERAGPDCARRPAAADQSAETAPEAMTSRRGFIRWLPTRTS